MWGRLTVEQPKGLGPHSSIPIGERRGLETVNMLNTAGWLSYDEKREKMGYGKIPMGDRVLTQMGTVPLDTQLAGQDATALRDREISALNGIRLRTNPRRRMSMRDSRGVLPSNLIFLKMCN